MALLFEVAVGKGRLIVSASDVLGHLDMPEVLQYYTSILAYAAAAPAGTLGELSAEQVRRIFPV